ncbi:High affinity transport system protein p37 precursor [Malacoplasma iowae]|nr:High affinity transport system protein p37 [Malacoplasma iowae 695]VEU62287.1 High affinity transport system protein p37 precursor [Mycoplasmopsis fermentans]VEU72464.1 High affinity transport system protein p37 precursor [Malacoplasma iowae]
MGFEMKNKKKLTLLFSVSTMLIPFVLSGCSNDNNTYTFYLSSSHDNGEGIDNGKQFAKRIEQIVNQQNAKTNLPKIKINYHLVTDPQVKISKLKNGSADFAFIPMGKSIDNQLVNYSQPKIQTLTDAFVFDKEDDKFYSDGGTNDPLRIIAEEMQKVSFDKNPIFENWGLSFGWNNIRHDDFYAKDSKTSNYILTDHYRGMIVLNGTDEDIKKAENAWDTRDWESFRNLGIIYGDQSSDGNYKLQELLLKKHFKKDKNWTLNSDIEKYPDKYLKDDFGNTKMGISSNVISFTDEASFAWTPSNKTSYKTPNGKKIKILTVTDPLYYDIGFFSKRITGALLDNFIYAFKYLEINNLNTYGASIGYNGYREIKNYQTEVLDKYNKTFNG